MKFGVALPSSAHDGHNCHASAGDGSLVLHVALEGCCGHMGFHALASQQHAPGVANLANFLLPALGEVGGPEADLLEFEKRHLSLHEKGAAVPPPLPGVEGWGQDWLLGPEALPLLLQSSPTCAMVEPVWAAPWSRTKGEASSLSWIPEVQEVPIGQPGHTTASSSSQSRRPAPPGDFVRGSSSSVPFTPGGVEVADVIAQRHAPPEEALDGTWLTAALHGGPGLLADPPGLSHGIVFEPQKEGPEAPSTPAAPPTQTLKAPSELLRFDDLFSAQWEAAEAGGEPEPSEEAGQGGEESDQESPSSFAPASDDLAPSESGGLPVVEGKAIGTATAADELEHLLSRPGITTWHTASAGAPPRPRPFTNQEWVALDKVPGLPQRFKELVPNPALSFPFELDTFQKEAIYHLENRESVFVAAHTSAGKTVVAEYAFALAMKHCTRAIYTSPIKAISNQKFRDLSARFDVGLLTGDVSIRPEATCLIMTTEILRSMLYRGADLLRDVEWVIFDEVHYLNDVDRGVVWEEVIIMLPDHVGMVLLSATVPNKEEFANWIGRTKKKIIHVTGTTRRPVPLEHCLFYGGELYPVCRGEKMLLDGIRDVRAAHKARNAPAKPALPPSGGRGAPAARGRPTGRGGGGSGSKAAIVSAAAGGRDSWRSEASQLHTFVQLLSKRRLLPIVVFCFSKKLCDQNAEGLGSIDLTSASEKAAITSFCKQSLARLKGSDRQLPQVLRVTALLRRGLGVHHAGLLPIVKEVVEMLFCRGVIKVLFSTETFAMGVNAPARAVAFHSLRKHDGQSFRQLLPGEYTQMAGRAGRRGLDPVGTVIICCWDEVLDEGELRRLLLGKPTLLQSQFRLTYTMILNLLRVEDLTVEDMLKRSFAEFHAQRALPEQQQKLAEAEDALRQLAASDPVVCLYGDPTVEDYYEHAQQVEDDFKGLQSAMLASRQVEKALSVGRAVLAKMQPGQAPQLAMVVKGPLGEGSGTRAYLLLALEHGSTAAAVVETRAAAPQEGRIDGRRGAELAGATALGSGSRGSEVVRVVLPHRGKSGGVGYVLARVAAGAIVGICNAKVAACDPRGLLNEVSPAAYAAAVQALVALEKEHESGNPPLLDPVRDLKLGDVELVRQYRQLEVLLTSLARNPCHRCQLLPEHYPVAQHKGELRNRLRNIRHILSDAALQQMPDFDARVEVLQALGYVDAQRVVQLKGRVACEMNTGDELAATEMLFEDQLAHLDAPEAVALMSALVFQQKDASSPSLGPRLMDAHARFLETVIQLGVEQAKCGLQIDPEDYAAATLNFGLMEVVYEWAKGTPFAEICELTNVAEGTIVRTIVRLDETCREFQIAARLMGDSILVKKMEDASALIKRDIVFAASLYLGGSIPPT